MKRSHWIVYYVLTTNWNNTTTVTTGDFSFTLNRKGVFSPKDLEDVRQHIEQQFFNKNGKIGKTVITGYQRLGV